MCIGGLVTIRDRARFIVVGLCRSVCSLFESMNWTIIGDVNNRSATAVHLSYIAVVMHRACNDDQGVYNLPAFDTFIVNRI